MSFFSTAAGAQGAGYRACRRCLPDATPGSPEWDVAADVAARAMRLVADGVVEREGVDGLARALGYSTRQLNRVVTQQYGAGPLALARSRRAQTARVLIETTDLSFTDVAFAAGFASVRQFNDTLREVYAASPTELRTGAATRRVAGTSGTIRTRIAVREPFAADALHHFLAVHAVRGIEAAGPGWYERAVRLPHGPGVVRVELGRPDARLRRRAPSRWPTPATWRPPPNAPAGCSTPTATRSPSTTALAEDPLLAPLVDDAPGAARPGPLDGAEMAVQTVLGQQVSVAAARTAAARLVETHGEPLGLEGAHAVTRLFPTMADAGRSSTPSRCRCRASRGRALVGLAEALDSGDVRLDRSTDRAETRAALLALPGIGPWTADYVAHARAGRPRRLPAHRPRRAPRGRARSASTTWPTAARAGGPGAPTR